MPGSCGCVCCPFFIRCLYKNRRRPWAEAMGRLLRDLNYIVRKEVYDIRDAKQKDCEEPV